MRTIMFCPAAADGVNRVIETLKTGGDEALSWLKSNFMLVEEN